MLSNARISERKVRASVVGNVGDILTRPERIEAFIEKFQRRYRELLETSGSRLKVMDAQIARQRQHIEASRAALVTVPASKALGARLTTEEIKLAQSEAAAGRLDRSAPEGHAPPRPQTATESPGPSTFRLSWAPESLKI